MMAGKDDERKTLVERTSDKIISYVLDNSLQQGDRLPNEETLAAQLGVGRGTLREAVRQLCCRNILKTVRGSGTYIADRTGIPDDPLGFKFVDDNVKLSFDLIESRLVLEPDIAALAAARRTEEDCIALRKINAQTSALRESGGDYRESDLKFHCKIAECSKNGVFKILIPILTQSIIRATTVQVEAYDILSAEQKAKITNAAHTNIVDAICRGDTDGARYAMIHHLMHGREYYRKQLKAHLEEQEK